MSSFIRSIDRGEARVVLRGNLRPTGDQHLDCFLVALRGSLHEGGHAALIRRIRIRAESQKLSDDPYVTRKRGCYEWRSAGSVPAVHVCPLRKQRIQPFHLAGGGYREQGVIDVFRSRIGYRRKQGEGEHGFF